MARGGVSSRRVHARQAGLAAREAREAPQGVLVGRRGGRQTTAGELEVTEQARDVRLVFGDLSAGGDG